MEPEPKTLKPEDEQLLGEMVHTWDLLPNSLRIMSRDPVLLRAILELIKATTYVPGKIGLELKWLVAHVTSRAAGCRYCSAHSGHFAGKLASATQEKIDAVWQFEQSDLFSDAERAALRVALGAGVTPNAVTREQMADLRSYFDDDEVVEIVAVIGLFGFFNRWNDTFATELEEDPRDFADRYLPEGWIAAQWEQAPR